MKQSIHPVTSAKKEHKNIEYKGDGLTTCRICGKYLPFLSHNAQDWAWKLKKGRYTYNYCSYTHMRADEK